MSSDMSVCVVIPAFNREATIARSVKSVLNQSLPADRLIVIDDGSTDRSLDVARSAGADVLAQTNQGVASARNGGMRASGERWVAFLDADDEWHTDHLATIIPRIPGHVLAATNARRIPTRRLAGHPQPHAVQIGSRDVWWPQNPICTSATVIDRAAALKVSGFRPLSLGEDRDLWSRMLTKGTGVLLPEVTVNYFEHDQQASVNRDAMRTSSLDLLRAFVDEPWVDADLLDRVDASVRWDLARAQGRRPSAIKTLVTLGVGASSWRGVRELLTYRRALHRAASR